MNNIRFYKPPSAPKSPKSSKSHPPHSKATLPLAQETSKTEQPAPEPALLSLPGIQSLNHPLPKKPLVSFPGESLASSLEGASNSGIAEAVYNPSSATVETTPSITRALDNSLCREKPESLQCPNLQVSSSHQLFSLPPAPEHFSTNHVSSIPSPNLGKGVEEGDSPYSVKSQLRRLSKTEDLPSIHPHCMLPHSGSDRSSLQEHIVNNHQDGQTRDHRSSIEVDATLTKSTALSCTPEDQYSPGEKQARSHDDHHSKHISPNRNNQPQPHVRTSGYKVPRVEVVVPQRIISPTLDAETILSSEDNDDPDDLDFQRQSSTSDEEVGPQSRLQRKRQTSAGSDSQPKRPRTKIRPSTSSKSVQRQRLPKAGFVRPVPLAYQPLHREHQQHLKHSFTRDSDTTSLEETSDPAEQHYSERIAINGYLELSPGGLGNSFVIRGFLPYPAQTRRDKHTDISRSPEFDEALGGSEPVFAESEEFDYCKTGRRFSEAEDELILILKEKRYTWKDMERFFTHRKHTALRSRWTRQLQYIKRK
ncbi:unnamed protein product [Aspergillus oryzae]|uniref:Unnamed protein product n=1 Tax=Aspergillus oryzae TaxID=5062 RepID=A0AAN4YZN9_ASPOZ|nr:unnamed protein product [Aspergillus oryzae]GMG38396.1 unnamed protein product [Aspergillus oryzae]